jgi:hypothetical protein
LIGFSIKNISGGTYTLGSRIISEYKQTIANDIYKYFDKYPHKLFFINENEYFYVLIKTDYQITQSLDTAYHGNFLKFRQNQDFLKQFELFKISDYRFHNVEVTADINLIISLYGVHDNDIFKLINSTQVIVDSFEPNSKYNIIQLSDFRSKLALDQDMSEFQQLKQILDINEIKLKFKIFNFVNENINFPIFNDLKLMAFSTDAIIRLLPKKLHKIAIKHLASKAIEQFSKNIRSNESLMINYPIESLNNPDFSSQTFYSKIAYFNINAKQIIVLLDLDHLKENHDHAINNILNLKKIGIRVVCNNITAKTIDFVNAVKPYFVFLRALNTKDPKIKELQKLMKKILTKIKVKYYMTN